MQKVPCKNSCREWRTLEKYKRGTAKELGCVTYPFGIRNFYVADPEGNLLEIGSTNET